jgi:outer membrane lipoprotein SlyB
VAQKERNPCLDYPIFKIFRAAEKVRVNEKSKISMKRKTTALMFGLLVFIPLLFVSCANMTFAQKGAVGGAAVGAVGGQLIGGNTKSTLIGAGAGALGGALLNDAMNK